MAVDTLTIGFYEFFFIMIALVTQTIVLTTWLTRQKIRIDYMEIYIKEEITAAKEIHKELKDQIVELKNFFVDWIQRLENVTRDAPKNIDTLNLKTSKSEELDRGSDKKLNLIIDTIEKLTNQISRLVDTQPTVHSQN